ncbi:MAG: hypothetical protein J6A63_01255 [Clostridia bacterium]|nr:hypothetical protein [Clostridia bacterium]
MMKEKLAYAYLELKIFGLSEEDVITTSTGAGDSDESYDDMGAWKDSWSK